MTVGDRPRRTRRWAVVLGVLVLGCVVGWLLSSDTPEAPSPEAAPRAQRRTPPPAPSEPEPAPISASPEARPDAAVGAPVRPAAPVVDAVLVEKQEVCSGEDNLITVKAHTPDGNDAFLHYKVGTGTGVSVPVRVWMEPDGTYTLPTVTVFSRENVSTTVPVPRYTVKPCEPERIVEIFSRQMPNSLDDYEFLARLIEPRATPEQSQGKPFVPVRYVWTFNDRDTRTTTTPLVAYSFTKGRAESQYVQHLIRVEVFDAAGRKVTGRSSLQMLDVSFENFTKKGVVTILSAGTPRFPVLDADGVVRQTFRLYHHWRGPVRIEKVTAIRAFMPRTDGPTPPDQVDAASLPMDSISESGGVEVPVTLDTKAEPEVFSITWSLEGTSADGHPARGTFSVMRPPPRPTKDSNIPVTDPVLLAKIKRARELLNQDYVTDEDIWRLEREGRFVDLRVEGAPVGRPPSPAPPGQPRK
jgi:hypothetical protein